MGILWKRRSATVAEVRADLEEPLAYTSVLSALQALEQKGHVRHELEGRAHRYYPAVDAAQAGTSALARIRDAIFQGSTVRMFAHLVADEGLSLEELQAARQLLLERLRDPA
jgi:predicted transcriptional regulator